LNKNLNRLIEQLKQESERLTSLFRTDDERKELQYAIDFFQARIQAMIRATTGNLQWYLDEGWKLFSEEESEKDG